VSVNIKRRPHEERSRGFTLVELMISVAVLGVIAVGIMYIFVDYLQQITRSGILTDMTADSQNLLRATVEELRYGAGVRQTNSITDANGPSGGWNTSNTNFVIVIAFPAQDSDRNYIIDTATGQPYNNEFVYFKQDNVLYKRILANPSATDNSLRTSCPASLASASCPADRELLDTIDDMVFTLYDQDNAVTADPLLARSVKVDLSLSKDTFGDPLTLDYSIQTTLRNNFQ
jgi:prepilin-type N-terminal cleavage/methylation domain-containing protein